MKILPFYNCQNYCVDFFLIEQSKYSVREFLETKNNLWGLSALTEALLDPEAWGGTKLGIAWAVTIEPVEL